MNGIDTDVWNWNDTDYFYGKYADYWIVYNTDYCNGIDTTFVMELILISRMGSILTTGMWSKLTPWIELIVTTGLRNWQLLMKWDWFWLTELN